MRIDPIAKAAIARRAEWLTTAATLAGTIGLLLLSACAGAPTDGAAADATAAADRVERSDRQTGSNLPRRSGQTSSVIVADPAAVQSGGRSTTRSAGTGP
jgi:hypothetical protein